LYYHFQTSVANPATTPNLCQDHDWSRLVDAAAGISSAWDIVHGEVPPPVLKAAWFWFGDWPN